MSLFEILVRGGWLIIPIALASIVVIALGVNRYLALRAEKEQLSRFLGEWLEAFPGAEPERYLAACKAGPRVVADMATSLVRGRYPRQEAADKIESLARVELARLEYGLGTIATLAAVAPLLGFLGTVTGMIRAFMQIQNLGGNVNANVLAGGIWEALVTTVAGLIVSIIALIIHNYVTSLVAKHAQRLELVGELTLNVLSRRQ
jgi:biopolymer transport protein ExbB